MNLHSVRSSEFNVTVGGEECEIQGSPSSEKAMHIYIAYFQVADFSHNLIGVYHEYCLYSSLGI